MVFQAFQIPKNHFMLGVAFAAVLSACNKTKFAGGAKISAREQRVVASDEKSIETTKKLNLWVVTRQQNAVKTWNNATTEQGSQQVRVDDLDQVTVGMKLSGPGIDSECDDATTPNNECSGRDYAIGAITAIDPTTKTLTIKGKIRSINAPTVLALNQQTTDSLKHWIDVPLATDISSVRVGMVVSGPGLNEECDDPSNDTPSTKILDCVGLATITEIRDGNPPNIGPITPGTQTIIFDRFISHQTKIRSGLTSEHSSNKLTVGDLTGLAVGMVVDGPGLRVTCDDPNTQVNECPGRALVSSVDVNTKTITIDRPIKHSNGATNSNLTYQFFERTRTNQTYNVRGGQITGKFTAQTGIAHWLQLEGDKILQHKKWSGVDSSVFDLGLRTYVTEGGILIGKYPFVYFIDPENMPEGPIPAAGRKDISDASRKRDNIRICLASYLKNDQRFMIAAFGAGRYYEIPMADIRPYNPLWDDLSKIPLRQIDGARGDETTVRAYSTPLEGIGWGYSCHINQRKKIFYSQWAFVGPKLLLTADSTSTRAAAVDLTTHKEVNLDAIVPNAKFVQNNPVLKSFALSVSSAKGSYAVAGDPDGNIYNADRDAILPPFQGSTVGEGNLTYTMAYEKISDTIWISRSSNKIAVVKRKCLTTEPNCTDKDYHFAEVPPVSGDSDVMATVGPISALKDGRVVGLSRSNPTRVRIFSLKDPADVTKGIDALPLTKIDGDPYMYVDFTGATLYTRESEQTVKIKDVPGYAKRSKTDLRADTLIESYFEWNNLAETSDEWKGMKLEARCYEEDSSKGNYQEIPVVAKAGEKTLLDIPSCKNKFVEAIDIKITQIKGESLGDIKSVKIHVKQ